MALETLSGDWVQVSRLGMPLPMNRIPIGYKDYWNSQSPYNDAYFLPVLL